MNVYVDIDETICCYEGERFYELALPIYDNIAKINKLYDQGNRITYWTARGTVTGINWYDITQDQLNRWGCKYHSLIVGEKPAYDLLICDKTKRIEEL
jgi:CMP-N,N'-diacetyllegionaminic acid synthase